MERKTEERQFEGNGISRKDFLRGSLALGAFGLLTATGAGAAIGQAAKKGGVLRIGVGGSGAKSSLNPLTETGGGLDFAVSQSIFDRLTDFDKSGNLYNSLAEEFSHNSDGTIWKIKLRGGVLWHDGSPFTAADVVYTLKFVLDPNNKADAYSNLSPFMTPNGIRALDPTTVEITLTGPYALLPQILGSKVMLIVKDGTTDFDHPVGTGPFKFQSWERGQRVSLVKNESFRVSGQPYLDGVEFIAINDPMARLNSLVAGQVHAIAQLDGNLARVALANPAIKLLRSKSGATTDQFMMVNQEPFKDVRVRQAFRLMIDRQQLVDNALAGYGTIGNDLHCITDPDYAHEIPQREQDPDKAKHLLKAAGYDGNLSLPFYASDAAPGMLASATLIANQAKQVGVDLKLQVVQSESYYSGTNFKKLPFECSDWGQHTLESQIGQGYTRGAYWNEPDWTNDKFDEWVAKARTAFDPKQRREYYVEAQKILHEEGGYIIWGFRELLDAVSDKVVGIEPSNQRNLGYYRFEQVSLA